MSRKRLICPNPAHNEKTPSYVLYGDYGHCFGCGYSSKLEGNNEQQTKAEPIEKEDLEEAFAYINSLPTKSIRGLALPYDNLFYYVLFPGTNYYKRRSFNDVGSKYLCPTGHKKPLYVPYKTNKQDALAIVEGELNALSLSQAKPPFDVCSPGGCSSFYGSDYERYKQIYLTYNRFIIIVDKDSAGVKAAIELKAKLITKKPDVVVILMDHDLNDILMEDGIEGIKKRMGLQRGL